MPSIDRGRETRVLWELLDRSGQSRTRVDEVNGDDDTWTQLRLWLAYTSDNDDVANQFEVWTGRPREVVSAWGGITQDLELRRRDCAPRLRVVRIA